MLPRATARHLPEAWGLREAKATLQAQKAKAAAFGTSCAKTLPRAVARPVDKAHGLKEAKTTLEA
jgi:hypothetical protein